MWETIKSIAFVITTVMIALIFQARASSTESNDLSEKLSAEQRIEQLDFASSLPSSFEGHQ